MVNHKTKVEVLELSSVNYQLEISEIENRKIIERSNEIIRWFFGEINKIDKHLDI
jgi:hypothetical protein